MNKCYVIAEAGVNHNGDVLKAKEMIFAAKAAGADAIKFQMFEAESLVTKKAKQAEYQIINCQYEKTQYEMLKDLELSRDDFLYLKEIADREGIDYIITPFDLNSLRFIVNDLKIETIKIASGDITFGPLLLQAARTDCPIILSTGMSTLDEIEQALKILAFGGLEKTGYPNEKKLDELYHSDNAKEFLKKQITLLHCVSEYPAPYAEMDLKNIDLLAKQFSLRVGLSDHSEGTVVPIAAVARGACLIEKHFTLDKTLPGSDHLASLDPQELCQMIQGIRIVEQALGQGQKIVKPSEAKNKTLVRRSLIANHAIQMGESFTEENVTMKRPGEGISPMRFWSYIDQKATRAYEKDEVLS